MIEETQKPWRDLENTNLSQPKWDIGARVFVFKIVLNFFFP